jgi:hypothetical protein
MKWAAVGLGAAVLAVAGGAFALTTRDDGPRTRDGVTSTEAAATVGLTPLLKGETSPPCRSDGGEDRDSTGDDRSDGRNAAPTCPADGENENENEAAGDEESGDSSADESGDRQTGDKNDSGN